MEQYHELCKRILRDGVLKEDRTGVGRCSVTGAEIEFDLGDGFPLLTTKRVPFRLIASELLWFISGNTNIRYLLENKNYIWNEWPFKKWVESDEYREEGLPDMANFGVRAENDVEFKTVYQGVMAEYCRRVLEDDDFSEKFGDIGRGYGAQWRNAFYVNPDTLVVGYYDQLGNVIDELKRNPASSRLIVSSFTTDNRKHAELPCCHHQYQFIVREGYLDLVWDQRSVDVFLGLPFNIASYAMLVHMIAPLVGLKPGILKGHLKDVHLYANHFDQVNELLSRDIRELPELVVKRVVDSIDDYELGDFEVVGYDPHKAIKAPVAV